jgi:DNA-binding NarL/FixJ family response regulator
MGEWSRKHVAICPHCQRIVEALPLTFRQWEVASRLIYGESIKKIAHDLFICRKTVEAHKRYILDILNIDNVPQLIRWANDIGLLKLMGWETPNHPPPTQWRSYK